MRRVAVLVVCSGLALGGTAACSSGGSGGSPLSLGTTHQKPAQHSTSPAQDSTSGVNSAILSQAKTVVRQYWQDRAALKYNEATALATGPLAGWTTYNAYLTFTDASACGKPTT